MTSLDELPDIAELSIVEGPEPAPAGAPSSSEASMRMGSASTSSAPAGDKQARGVASGMVCVTILFRWML